eukprot:TRINITY_DN2203_c0_g1_i1.p1 TRINITY_DN2203_c0_g1~~TRINITY_DN2203_c0_g1_i1.p1  ORF type:complete len:583 (+),score=119.53 TRINITY_DN2203_c0_g1_i1:124-1749(+)
MLTNVSIADYLGINPLVSCWDALLRKYCNWKLVLDSVQNICQEFMSENIETTISDLLAYNLKDMVKLDMLPEDESLMLRVFRSNYIQEDENELWKIMQEWLTKNSEHDPVPFIECLRFELMSVEALLSMSEFKAVPSEILVKAHSKVNVEDNGEKNERGEPLNLNNIELLLPDLHEKFTKSLIVATVGLDSIDVECSDKILKMNPFFLCGHSKELRDIVAKFNGIGWKQFRSCDISRFERMLREDSLDTYDEDNLEALLDIADDIHETMLLARIAAEYVQMFANDDNQRTSCYLRFINGLENENESYCQSVFADVWYNLFDKDALPDLVFLSEVFLRCSTATVLKLLEDYGNCLNINELALSRVLEKWLDKNPNVEPSMILAKLRCGLLTSNRLHELSNKYKEGFESEKLLKIFKEQEIPTPVRYKNFGNDFKNRSEGPLRRIKKSLKTEKMFEKSAVIHPNSTCTFETVALDSPVGSTMGFNITRIRQQSCLENPELRIYMMETNGVFLNGGAFDKEPHKAIAFDSFHKFVWILQEKQSI